jgi:predicted RNase H-like HicB family nuclease
MKSFTAVIERDAETGLLGSSVPGLPGAHTQAETMEELSANLKEALQLRLEEGAPSFEAEFVGTQTIRIA